MPRDWDSLEETVQKVSGKAPMGSPTVEQINECINKACMQVCGHVPTNVNECKGHTLETVPHYTCKVRLISDNITFTQEMGWYILVTGYYRELLEVIKGDKDTTSST